MGMFEDETPHGASPHSVGVGVVRHALMQRVCFPFVRGAGHAFCVSLHGPAMAGKTTLARAAAQHLIDRGRAGRGARLVKVTGCHSEAELALATLRELKRSPFCAPPSLSLAALTSLPDDPRITWYPG